MSEKKKLLSTKEAAEYCGSSSPTSALRRLFWNRHFVHGQVHTTLNENLFPSKRIRFGFSDIH